MEQPLVPHSQETAMLITIDNMANRYKMLPSEVLARATTFDLMVLDQSAKWERYQHEKSKNPGTVNSAAETPSVERMQAMMKYAKELQNGNIKRKD